MKLSAAIAWIATGAACVAAATAVYVQAGNTLIRNGRWTTSKLELAQSVPHVIETITRRDALRHGWLNPGVWRGFQEFVAAQVDDYRVIEFDFRVPPTSYFTFVFGKDRKGFYGIRLSRQGMYPSAFITASGEGEFREIQPLKRLNGRGWSHARLELVGDEADFQVDGGSWGRFKVPHKGASRFGFRGSHADAFIDNVEARNARGELVFKETFENTRGLWTCALASALVLTLIQLLFLQLYRQLHGAALNRAMVRGSYLNGLLTIVALRIYAADPAWILPAYPEPFRFAKYRENVEMNDLVLAGIQARYTRPNPGRRILFLGNSQTWGDGAKYKEDSMTQRVQQRLGGSYECINGAVIGSSSRLMLQDLKSELYKLRPSLIVANISDDPQALPDFESNLKSIIEFGRSQGIETLLVLPANEPLARRKFLDANHRVVRAVAASEGVRLLDLDGILKQRHDSGFLWWDQTHLTSYGQKLAADALYPPIAELLGKHKG